MNEWLKIEEAAQILRVNPTTLRIWAREGKIKARKYGRCWRIHRSVVEAA
ncbi:helix-turn-helix domain-containing protein [Alicyclobacillus tolerans]|nr:helix-turn-helix domain-containing protein [Alicyclobacillus tolerans]MCF8564983.1 helix-turn-helix domain-containing protein [Alicyclobacillus tolerans]